MTQGICYFLCGNWQRYLGPLVVSLHSLRQHWDGPVCILADETTIGSMKFKMFVDFGVRITAKLKLIDLAPVPRHVPYVTKATLWRHSPFDRTLLLDADTVVTGDINELFQAKLTVTQFCEWRTTGKIVGGRLQQWADRGIRPNRVWKLRQFAEPAINTGVVAWDRGGAPLMLEEWEQLTREGWECSFTDELAMQILWNDFAAKGGRLLDDRFNCSAIFGVNRDDARIWHYHGRRMVRRAEAGAMYRPHLLAALEANAGGIADWLKEVDPPLWSLAQ